MPLWSLANGRQSRLKAFSNDRFFPILLNEKWKRDGYSIGGSRRAKVRVASSENAVLIIWFHWPYLPFLKISVGICRDNYIEKSGDDSGINKVDGNGNRKADKPNISTENLDKDKRVDNIGTNTVDVDRTDDSNIGITDIDGVDNIGTDIVDGDRDGGVDIPDIDIIDSNRAKDLVTGW